MITVVGSLNYDLVTYTRRVPDGGETYQADAFETHLGGKGLNEAIAAARLMSTENGANSDKVRMIGCTGDDGFGSELKGALEEAGVDVSLVKTVANTKSGVAVILVEEETGENRILITSGANGTLRPSDAEYATFFPDSIANDGHFVVVQNEYPDTLKTITWLKHNRPKINVCYNPSPFKSEWISSDILARVDLFIVNEGEALDVARALGHKQQDPIQLASVLQQSICQDGVSTVIITLGSHGSVYVDKTMATPQRAPSEKASHVVDTTGAGDTFFGGIVVQLSKCKSLKEAVTFATKASSLTIQKHGAAESIPRWTDVVDSQ